MIAQLRHDIDFEVHWKMTEIV